MIKYSGAFPDAKFAVVDLVLTVPRYKGAPYESQVSQSSRILSACRQSGHQLPTY